MNQLFKNKTILQKIIVYTTAAMLFTTLPAPSVYAAEESAQLPSTPAPPQNTPGENVPTPPSTPAETNPAESQPSQTPPPSLMRVQSYL